MARTTGPLLSFDASGSVGGAITFSKWKGRSYVRQLVIPANPRTASQTAFRALFKFLSQNWAALTAPDKDTWDGLANADKVSDFNAYMAKNQQAWKSFLPPSQAYPQDRLLAPAALAALVGTGGIGQASIDIELVAPANNWGYVLFRALGAAPTGVLSEVVQVGLLDMADIKTYVDSPLSAGTWHYKARPFSTDGLFGALGADEAIVVT